MPKSGRQVKAAFVLRGETVKSWAERNGFPLPTVRAVINGHVKGNRGIGHEVAVALGMKRKPRPQAGERGTT